MEQHVVANHSGVEEEFRVVACDGVETRATFDPVIAFVAEQEVFAGTAEDEVVAFAAERFSGVLTEDKVVLAFVAEYEVGAAGFRDYVIALVAAQHVITEWIFDDVVALAAEYVVGFCAGIDVVVTAITPNGIDALVSEDSVVAFGAADHNVFAAREAECAAYMMAVAATLPFVVGCCAKLRMTLSGSKDTVRFSDGPLDQCRSTPFNLSSQ